MPFKVQVGPQQVAIHHGQTLLVSEPDGQINWPSERGLYFYDTRVISSWAIYANGEPWILLNGGAITHYASRTYLTNRNVPTADGVIPRPHTWPCHQSYGQRRCCMKIWTLPTTACSGYAFSSRSRCVATSPTSSRSSRTTSFDGAGSRPTGRTPSSNCARVIATAISPAPWQLLRLQGRPSGTYANGRLSFEINLDPGEAWHCCLLYALEDGDRSFPAPHECADDHQKTHHAETLSDWLQSVLKIRTSNEEFYRLYHQALEDMAALRLPDRRHRP